MLKLCISPASMAPMPGSTLTGGSSGFPVRRDMTLARALEGRASLNMADLLPGRGLWVPSVIEHTFTAHSPKLHSGMHWNVMFNSIFEDNGTANTVFAVIYNVDFRIYNNKKYEWYLFVHGLKCCYSDPWWLARRIPISQCRDSLSVVCRDAHKQTT